VISDNIIQADFVTDLKADAAVLAIIAAATEVKEDQYQGTVFVYPAVRVSIESQTPITNRGPSCDHARLRMTLYAYTEEASSKNADILAGIMNAKYHRRFFRGTGWFIWLYSSGLRSAVRITERLWRADVPLIGTVYPSTATP